MFSFKVNWQTKGGANSELQIRLQKVDTGKACQRSGFARGEMLQPETTTCAFVLPDRAAADVCVL